MPRFKITNKQRKFIGGTAGALVIVLMIGYLKYVSDDTTRFNKTKAQGIYLVSAIKRYRVEQKHLPESLEALVPEYAEFVPVPIWGEQAWAYDTWCKSGSTADTDCKFFLAVEKPSVRLYFNSDDDRWFMH